MGRLIYTLNVSLDGFVETADHSPDWGTADDELLTWFSETTRELDARSDTQFQSFLLCRDEPCAMAVAGDRGLRVRGTRPHLIRCGRHRSHSRVGEASHCREC